MVGLLGALIGITRSNTLDQLYEPEYLSFFLKDQSGTKTREHPSQNNILYQSSLIKAFDNKTRKKRNTGKTRIQVFHTLYG